MRVGHGRSRYVLAKDCHRHTPAAAAFNDQLGAEATAAPTSGPAELEATRERAGEDRVVSPMVASGLCVTCLVRPGTPRATVLRAVVCGPCWAAHGGFPDAGEMGPSPAITVASADPRGQWHWLSALRRQGWVEQIRSDGRANLLEVARLVALHAGWDTLESRPTWARLIVRSGLSERTVARWLQELRVRGWLAHLEHGSTPAHRPMVLAQLAGNRAAVYGLRIPLTPEEALHRALEQLLARLVADLTEHATADATPTDSQRPPAPAPPGQDSAEDGAATPGPVPAGSDPPVPVADSTRPPESGQEQDQPRSAVDTTGSPTRFGLIFKKSWVDGFTRASEPVDNGGAIPAKYGEKTPRNHPRTALRAGSEQRSGPDWALTVPTSGFAMLIAAGWLRRRLQVFARCSRKLIRHLCKPYWRAGWTNRDIIHALDHRPGVFGQTPGVLISPDRVAAPQVFITSRLAAWRNPAGVILPGHVSSRLADAAAATAARAQVRSRHGRAGAALLRPGERSLTPGRITEAGRAARPPAGPATRAAAKATLAATLRAHRQPTAQASR